MKTVEEKGGEGKRRERRRKKGERSSFAGITRYFPGGRVTDCVNWIRFPQQRQKGTTRLYRDKEAAALVGCSCVHR